MKIKIQMTTTKIGKIGKIERKVAREGKKVLRRTRLRERSINSCSFMILKMIPTMMSLKFQISTIHLSERKIQLKLEI